MTTDPQSPQQTLGRSRSILRSDAVFLMAALAVSVVMILAVIASIRFTAPPRFDETGYLILARALAEGDGYREIDKPGSPPHAHFPPGWPIVLSSVWSMVPESVESRTRSAHALVAVIWLLSLGLTIRWFRIACPSSYSTGLSLALCGNWLWSRLAGELRSESLYILISSLVFLAMLDMKNKRPISRAIFIGILVGAGILTRHVGVALALAVATEYLFRRQFTSSIVSAATAAVIVMPWIVRQMRVGQGTQAELLIRQSSEGGTLDTIASQVLFYERRLPDSLFGPFVETATVFRNDKALAVAATIAALLFLIVLAIGLHGMFRHETTRMAASYFSISLAILVVWPFTEAGRFLIPLIPFTLTALAFGLDAIAHRFAGFFRLDHKFRSAIIALIPVLTLPFGLYTCLKSMRTAPNQSETEYELVCDWIVRNTPADSVFSARHPGDLFWRTGRVAVPWPTADSPDSAAELLTMQCVDFLISDSGRYVGEPLPNWLPMNDPQESPTAFQKLQGPGISGDIMLWRIDGSNEL